MAGSYLYQEQKQKYDYLENDVLNALIIRDIIQKKRIRNIPLLNALIDYLMDHIGNLISARKIANHLNSSKLKADHKTIEKYLGFLTSAFAFYRIRRYDIKGKRYLTSDCKYYLSDQSFRFARLGTKNMDYGHVLENVIVIELLRRGYEVYVGALRKTEIDFVAVSRGEKCYIQVAYDISSHDTLARELKSLRSISDAYPKMLIARTYQPEYEIDGIRIIDAAEWLKASNN